MKKRLKKIAPLQLGKVLGIAYALFSLVFVPFLLIFPLIASLAPQAEGQSVPMVPAIGMGIGFIFFAPVMYGLMGFISGVIGAFVYNIVAKWVGGIEVEVE